MNNKVEFSINCQKFENRKMKNISKIITAILLITSLLYCSNSKEKNKTIQKPITNLTPAFVKGNVTSAGSFSYYLPSYYSDSSKFPLIYVFSAHGDGNLPLNRFYQLAEKYGFIMVASNVSKNGLPANILEPALKQFYSDPLNKFSVDEKRLYTMGFSGGARVASIMTMENPQIRGAILCGGGLAYPSIPENRVPDFLLFAGKDDFNSIELMHLDTTLGTKFRHFLAKFNGKHEWPPATNMEDGFYWTLFNEMKDGIIPKNDTLLQSFITTNSEILNSSKDILDKYYYLKKITAFLNNIADIKSYQDKLNNIKSSSEFVKRSKEMEKFYQKEQMQEEQLVKKMETQPLDWWQKKTSEMAVDTEQNTLQAHSNKRILNYLSLAAYMQCSNTLKANQVQYAYSFIKLYQTIDPKNTEGFYMEAQLDAKQGKFPGAISALQHAADIGFKDMDRINNEPEFQPLFNMPEFQNVIETIGK